MGMIDIYNGETENEAVEDAPIELKGLVASDLSAHVMRCWHEAKSAKSSIENQMLTNLRQRRGEYEADKLSAIKAQGLSDIFLKLTDAKCRGTESWIRDVLLPAGDKPWTMEATPIPDLPLELEQLTLQHALMGGVPPDAIDQLKSAVLEAAQQDSEQRANAMELLCEDQQVQGGFRNALDAIISDVVTLKAGVMKAPVLRMQDTLSWGRNYQPIIEDKIVMRFERVSPFDLYPSPGATDCQTAAYVIEHHHLQPGDLECLLDVDGYNKDEIEAVLHEYGEMSLGGWLQLSDDIRDAQRSEHEKNAVSNSSLATEIDSLQYFGQVRGSWLLDWGARDSIEPDRWYEAEVWSVGNHVIKAVLNEHPLKLRPYYHTGAIKINDQFWHQSIPELMDDCQDVINASVRNLVNNMGMASGPQVGVDFSRLPQGYDYQNIHPWKIWTFKEDDTGRGSNPIQFFQPASNAGELVSVLEKFKVWADELTGIPAYTQGIGQASGAGATASGLSMLMNSAAKGIRSIIFNIDRDIVERVLYAQFVHNMLYHDDESVKGDIMIKPRGAAALIVKEQMQLRRGEFLAQTANPIDMQIIGMEGRAELLREAVRALDMPVDRIIPTEEKLKQMQQPPQQPMPPQQDPTQNLAPDGSPTGGQAFNQF